MRTTIIRTITATTIESVHVAFEKGQPKFVKNDTLTLNGKIDEASALKIIRKTFGENAQLQAVEETTNVYEISVDDFIKYATIVKDEKEVASENTEVKEV